MTRPEFVALCARILPPRLSRWSELVYVAAQMTDLDPLLVMAVLDRESGGGIFLSTKGPDGTGDRGYGLGLMQIDRRYHALFAAETIMGKLAWQEPYCNIAYGAQVLARAIKHFAQASLRLHADVALHAGVAAYNASAGRIATRLAPLRKAAVAVQLEAIDACTTKGPSGAPDYASDVLARRKRWIELAASTPTTPKEGSTP